MAVKLEVSVSYFYCQLALELCQIARFLAQNGKHKEAAELCKFISTLCAKKPLSICKLESKLCSMSAEARLKGDIALAEKYCLEARKLCPKNYEAKGG